MKRLVLVAQDYLVTIVLGRDEQPSATSASFRKGAAPFPLPGAYVSIAAAHELEGIVVGCYPDYVADRCMLAVLLR